MTERSAGEPPPVTICPTPTPSSCLADDYEGARRRGVHVRILEAGRTAGACWCGRVHDEQPASGPPLYDIHVTTTRYE